jgi:hypothetical protein
MAVIIGIVEVIMPACEADVYCRAFDSNKKYNPGSNSDKSSIYLTSCLLNLYFVKPFIKYKKQSDATNIRKNITLYAPVSAIADFSAIKELPQISIAKISDKNANIEIL